jgi:hypothetical protein
MKEQIDLARDVLDKQLIDRDGTKMGRVDGLVLLLDDDGRPRLDHMQLGFVVLARRVHPRLEKWLEKIRERWSVRKVARQVVEWEKVTELTTGHIKVDLLARETPAFDWERWLRDKIVMHLPGAGKE